MKTQEGRGSSPGGTPHTSGCVISSLIASFNVFLQERALLGFISVQEAFGLWEVEEKQASTWQSSAAGGGVGSQGVCSGVGLNVKGTTCW